MLILLKLNIILFSEHIMSKKKEIPFVELRSHIKTFFHSLGDGQLMDYFINDPKKPWAASIANYSKIREALENTLKKSLLSQQAEIEDLVDEYLVTLGDENAFATNKDDASKSPKKSSKKEVPKVPDLLEGEATAKNSDNKTGFSRVPVKRKSEDDIMSISSDSSNASFLNKVKDNPREATPSSKSEKVQDPKERTTGPSVSKPKRVRKQTDPVEMPKIRKSQRQTRSSCSKSSPEMDETSSDSLDEESVSSSLFGSQRVTRQGLHRILSSSDSAVDDEVPEVQTKRKGNYKPAPKGGNIKQYSSCENLKMLEWIRDAEVNINDEYIQTCHHPALEFIRSGVGNKWTYPRTNSSIISKYNHRKDQEWWKAAVDFQDRQKMTPPTLKELFSYQYQVAELKMEKYHLQEDCENKDREIAEMKEQVLKFGKHNKNLTSTNADLFFQKSRVEEEVVTYKKKVAALELKLKNLSIKFGGEEAEGGADRNNNSSEQASDEDQVIETTNTTTARVKEGQSEEKTTDDDYQKAVNLNTTKDSLLDSISEDDRAPAVSSSQKQVYMKIFGSTLSSLSSDTSDEGNGKSSKLSSTKDKAGVSKADQDITLSSASIKFRADRHPLEKPTLKRIPMEDFSMVKKFNKRNIDSGLQVSDCIVKVQRMQEEKLAHFKIPQGKSTTVGISTAMAKIEYGDLLSIEMKKKKGSGDKK